MKRPKRLEEIKKKNAELEKETPYNYCDRWCERCVHEKQMRCSLYKDELERKMTCIAYGRDEDDPEITRSVMEEQYKDIDERVSGVKDKFGIDLDFPDIDEDEMDEESVCDLEDLPAEIQEHIRFVESDPLNAMAKEYYDKADAFLERTFYGVKDIDNELRKEFETVSWYHMLLPAKLRRALAGFHEMPVEGDTSLYDAVAQFGICDKAIDSSFAAFNVITDRRPSLRAGVMPLLTLLRDIKGRIKKLEDEI